MSYWEDYFNKSNEVDGSTVSPVTEGEAYMPYSTNQDFGTEGYQPIHDTSIQREWKFDIPERLVKGAQESFGTLLGLSSMLADSVGADTVKEWTYSKAQDLFEDAASHDVVTQEFKKIRNPEDAAKWGAEVLIGIIPDLALMMGTGAGFGTLGAKLTGKKAFKKILYDASKKRIKDNYKKLLPALGTKKAMDSAFKMTAREIGGLAGITAYEFGQGAGSSYLTDVKKRGFDNVSIGAAVASGAGQAAISRLNPLNKFLSKTMAGKAYLAAGKDVAEMTLGEAFEETGQEAVSILHEVGIDPSVSVKDAFTDKDNLLRLAESGLGGMLFGSVLSAPAGIRAMQKAKKEKSLQDAVEKERVENALIHKELSKYNIPSISSQVQEDASELMIKDVFKERDDLEKFKEASRRYVLSQNVKEQRRANLQDESVINSLITQAATAEPLEVQRLKGESIFDAAQRTRQNKIMDRQMSTYSPEAPADTASPAERSASIFARQKKQEDKTSAQRFVEHKAPTQKFIEQVAKERLNWIDKNQRKGPWNKGKMGEAVTKRTTPNSFIIDKLISNEKINKKIDEIMGTQEAPVIKTEKARNYLGSEITNLLKVEGIKKKEEKMKPTTAAGEVQLPSGNMVTATASPEDVLIANEGKSTEKPEAISITKAQKEIADELSKFQGSELASAILHGDIAKLLSALDKGTDSSRKDRFVMAVKEAAEFAKSGDNIDIDTVKDRAIEYLPLTKIPHRSGVDRLLVNIGDAANRSTQILMYVPDGTLYTASKRDDGSKRWDVYESNSKQVHTFNSLDDARKAILSSKPAKEDAKKAKEEKSRLKKENKAKNKKVPKLSEIEKKVNKEEKKNKESEETKEKKVEKEKGWKKVELSEEEKRKILERVNKKKEKTKVVKEVKKETKKNEELKKDPVDIAEDVLDTLYEEAGEGNHTAVLDLLHKNYKKDSKEKWFKEAVDIVEESINLEEKELSRYSEDGKIKIPDNGEDLLKQALAKNKEDKWIDLLASFLIKNDKEGLLKKIKVKKSDKNYSYHYKGTVYIARPMYLTEGSELHEIVHAITVQALEDPRNFKLRLELQALFEEARQKLLTPQELNIVNTMKTSSEFRDKFSSYQRQHNLKKSRSFYYGFINYKEFLSTAFGNPEFREALNNTKVESGGKIVSALKGLNNIVRKLLGLNVVQGNALEAVINKTLKLMKANYDFKVEPYPGYDVANADYDIDADATTADTNTLISKDLKNINKVKVGSSKTGWSAVYDKVKSEVEKTVEPLSEALNKIHPKLKALVRRMEFHIVRKNREYSKKIKPFLQTYSNMSEEDKSKLSYYLYNEEAREKNPDLKNMMNVLDKKYPGLKRDFSAVDLVLKDILKRQMEVGLNIDTKKMQNYFPRRIKDIKGLMEEIASKKDKKVKGPFDAVLDSEKLNTAEKEDLIYNVLNSGQYWKYAAKIPGSARGREIYHVRASFLPYYEDLANSLTSHIAENNEKIEGRALLGGKRGVKKVADRIRKLKKKYEDKPSDKLANEIAELTKQWEELSEFSDTAVNEMLTERNIDLSVDDQIKVVSLLRSRLNQKGMTGVWSNFRDIALISSLGSPMNAVTQLGDIVWSIYKNGPSATIAAAFGSKTFNKDDFDFTHALKEFTGAGSKTSALLDIVLSKTGFKWMDQFGKNVSMQASMNKAASMDFKSFKKKWGDLFESDKRLKEVHEKIKKGIKDEDTMFFVFNDISNYQPVSLSEMPPRYLEAGNGRIFYMLKSYAIKSLANIRREMRDPKLSKKERIAKTAYLVTLLTLGNAGVDELKDAILGNNEEEDFSDKMIDNLLNLGFMNRYSLDKGIKGNKPIETVLKDILLPPTSMIDAPLGDIYSFLNEDKKNTINSARIIPVVGQLGYEWFTDTSEFKHLDRQRSYWMDRLKKEGMTGEIRRGINKYNRDARKKLNTGGEDEVKLITARSIKKVNKSRRDKNNK